MVSRYLIELQYGTVFRRLSFLSFLLLAISKTDSVLAQELGENLRKFLERTNKVLQGDLAHFPLKAALRIKHTKFGLRVRPRLHS